MRFNICLAVILQALSYSVLALESDKDQPIEIEADTGELDDVRNVSIYRGNVVTVQGTIRMTGDKMTVYYTDDDEMDHMILEGRPATYKQLPEDSSVYDHAEALTMEYYELKEYVILIDKALVTQEGLRFSGDRIEYDTRLSKVQAWSNKPTKRSGVEKAAPEKKERVKIIIRKKKDKCGNEKYRKSLDAAQLKIFTRECEKKKAVGEKQ